MRTYPTYFENLGKFFRDGSFVDVKILARDVDVSRLPSARNLVGTVTALGIDEQEIVIGEVPIETSNTLETCLYSRTEAKWGIVLGISGDKVRIYEVVDTKGNLHHGFYGDLLGDMKRLGLIDSAVLQPA